MCQPCVQYHITTSVLYSVLYSPSPALGIPPSAVCSFYFYQAAPDIRGTSPHTHPRAYMHTLRHQGTGIPCAGTLLRAAIYSQRAVGETGPVGWGGGRGAGCMARGVDKAGRPGRLISVLDPPQNRHSNILTSPPSVCTEIHLYDTRALAPRRARCIQRGGMAAVLEIRVAGPVLQSMYMEW